MNTLQKTVKYISIGFAVILSVTIIGSIIAACFGVFEGIGGNASKEVMNFTQTYTDIENIDIDAGAAKIYIKIGDEFKVEANEVPESFTASVSSDKTLYITQNDNINHWFNFNNNKSEVIIYVPEGFIAKNVNLDCGVSKINVEQLRAESILIQSGTGKVIADIDYVKTLKIDGGVGKIDLTLNGKVEDYNFDIDSGIGKCTINGDKYTANMSSNNNADKNVEIDCGVGKINIDINE